VTADFSKSAALDQHLAAAIAEFSPRKDQTMARGLRRLKTLSETLVASVDAKAELAADALQKSHDEAVGAVDSIVATIGGEFKSAAADVKDMLNQISNDPTGK
jgi:hypothetical protein